MDIFLDLRIGNKSLNRMLSLNLYCSYFLSLFYHKFMYFDLAKLEVKLTTSLSGSNKKMDSVLINSIL